MEKPGEQFEAGSSRERPLAAERRSWIGGLERFGAPAMVLVLGGLVLSNVASWVEIQRLKSQSAVAVIAVHQMTDEYLHKLAALPLSNEEAGKLGTLFAVAAQEEAVKAAGPRRLLLARECVISGDADDLTSTVGASVEKRMSLVTSALGSNASAGSGGSAVLSALGIQPSRKR